MASPLREASKGSVRGTPRLSLRTVAFPMRSLRQAVIGPMLFLLVFEVTLHGSLQKGVRHECLLGLKFGSYFRTVIILWTEEFIVFLCSAVDI